MVSVNCDQPSIRTCTALPAAAAALAGKHGLTCTCLPLNAHSVG